MTRRSGDTGNFTRANRIDDGLGLRLRAPELVRAFPDYLPALTDRTMARVAETHKFIEKDITGVDIMAFAPHFS